MCAVLGSGRLDSAWFGSRCVAMCVLSFVAATFLLASRPHPSPLFVTSSLYHYTTCCCSSYYNEREKNRIPVSLVPISCFRHSVSYQVYVVSRFSLFPFVHTHVLVLVIVNMIRSWRWRTNSVMNFSSPRSFFSNPPPFRCDAGPFFFSSWLSFSNFISFTVCVFFDLPVVVVHVTYIDRRHCACPCWQHFIFQLQLLQF